MRSNISFNELPNGNLLFTANNPARSDIAYGLRVNGWDATWWDMMADFRDNGRLFPIEPEWIGALTTAPIVSDYESVDDEGSREIGEKVWWFPNYQITDPLEELARKGRVEFALAT